MIYQSFKMALKAIAGNKMRSFLTILGVVIGVVAIVVLVAIGQGRLSPDALDEALATQNRLLLGVTAPASGLELTRIFYDLDGERPEKWSVNDKYIGDFPVDESAGG